MMKMKVSESTEGSVILQKKGKRASTLQRKISLLQSLLCPRGPEAAATRWLPKHFSPLFNSAEKPIPGNPQSHSLLGHLSYSIIGLVFIISCCWQSALSPQLTDTCVLSFDLNNGLRQHLSLPPFENEERKLKVLRDSSEVTEVVRDRAGGTDSRFQSFSTTSNNHVLFLDS